MRQRPQTGQQLRLPARPVLRAGVRHRLADAAQGFPSYRTVQRRLKRWLALDTFRTAWRPLAQRCERRQGISGDQVLLDGSKKPSKKGVKKRALAR